MLPGYVYDPDDRVLREAGELLGFRVCRTCSKAVDEQNVNRVRIDFPRAVLEILRAMPEDMIADVFYHGIGAVGSECQECASS